MTVPANVRKMLESGAKSFYKLEKGKKMFFDFASNKYQADENQRKSHCAGRLKASKKKVVKSYLLCSLVDIGDGVFDLEFHSKMNAINKEMVDFMMEAGEYVLENGVGMVIGNQAAGMPGSIFRRR